MLVLEKTMRANEIIRAVLDVIDNLDPATLQPEEQPVGYTGNDMVRIQQIAGVLPTDGSMSVLANAPNEQYADISAVTGTGDDLNKSKHPSDIRGFPGSLFPNFQARPEGE